MIANFCALATCNRGASATEYALILSLVCTVLVIGLSALGTAVAAPFTEMTAAFAP